MKTIHTTKEYHLFKSIGGNRDVNQLHLTRLRKAIKLNYLFTVIVVNEHYEIIDGQHRFEVIKELGLPLNYVVCEGYGVVEVQQLNQNSKNWTMDDFLEGYCSLGKKDYIIYREFKNKHGFGHSECLYMLTGNTNGQLTKLFTDGFLVISSLKDANYKAELIHKIAPYYNGNKRRCFIYSILQLLKNKNFDFNEFLHKLSIQPTTLVDCVDTKQYVALIEDIYNFRRREKVNLRY
jgi:hypothetical protein